VDRHPEEETYFGVIKIIQKCGSLDKQIMKNDRKKFVKNFEDSHPEEDKYFW
jgi:hypothetical protein